MIYKLKSLLNACQNA